jgi:hypothetical protein
MTIYVVTDTMCGCCPHFEKNSTPFGGYCQNPDGQWHGKYVPIAISVQMDKQPCHPAMQEPAE